MGQGVDHGAVASQGSRSGRDGAQAQHPVRVFSLQGEHGAAQGLHPIPERGEVRNAAEGGCVPRRHQAAKEVQAETLHRLGHQAGDPGQIAPVGRADGGLLAGGEEVGFGLGFAWSRPAHDSPEQSPETDLLVDRNLSRRIAQIDHPTPGLPGLLNQPLGQGGGNAQPPEVFPRHHVFHHPDLWAVAGKGNRGRPRRMALHPGQSHLRPQVLAVGPPHGLKPVHVGSGPLLLEQLDNAHALGGPDGVGPVNHLHGPAVLEGDPFTPAHEPASPLPMGSLE